MMKKRYRIYSISIFLLSISIFLTGCSTVNKIEKKLGWKTEYFEYLNPKNVEQVSIQSTRDLGFKFIVTEEATKKEIYNLLSKAKKSEVKSSLDPDYIIEFDFGDKVEKFNFIVDSEGGNLYSDKAVYTVSESLVDSVIKNLSFTRKPRYFESIYYDCIQKVLSEVNKSLKESNLLNNNVKIGINIQGDAECSKYVYSKDIVNFVNKAKKIYPKTEMVNNNSNEFNVLLTVKNRGFDTTTYKTAITVTNKLDNTEHVYYVVSYYEYKKWNITVSKPDIKPSDW